MQDDPIWLHTVYNITLKVGTTAFNNITPKVESIPATPWHYPEKSNYIIKSVWITYFLSFLQQLRKTESQRSDCCSAKASSTAIFHTIQLSTNMSPKITNIIQSLFTDFLQMHILIMALQDCWCMHWKENRLGIFDNRIPSIWTRLPPLLGNQIVSVFKSRLHLFSTVHNLPYLPPCQPVSFIYCHTVYLPLPSTDGPSIA